MDFKMFFGLKIAKNRITFDPNILSGKPIIKGTRLAVEFILELLANGWTVEDILKNYPSAEEGRCNCCPKVCG